MQLISETTGAIYYISGLRVRISAPGDLLILNTAQGLTHIPNAIKDGNVVSLAAESALRRVGLITTLFDDPVMADLYDEETTRLECAFLQKALLATYQANDKVLDVGCGVGRILLPLTKNGYHVDGVDISRPAVDHLWGHLHEAGTRTSLIVSDIANLVLRPRYKFAFAAMNTVRYLGSGPRFRAHFNAMSSTVTPGGLYIFNMSFAVANAQGKARWVVGEKTYTWKSGMESRTEQIFDEEVQVAYTSGPSPHHEIQLQYAPPFEGVVQELQSIGWQVEQVYDSSGRTISKWADISRDGGSRWILCRNSLSKCWD